ncbi:MAG: type I-U CRISPR-associated protein Csx17 [Actinomycetota bacterium]|nr:type I-U CRISPR-associated protein Csx17 [Actinomycetota bacterium]
MTQHHFVAARGRNLQRSLAALGLVRVLAEQRDPPLRCRIDGTDLVIDTDVDDLVGWLVDEYRPRPVLSPWNGGSGFGANDKNQRSNIDALLNHPARSRLATMTWAVDRIDRLMERSHAGGWEKQYLIREVKNVCPDEMLPWLNSAVVVLSSGELAFPPLLGSGGNDGRLDFSSNYHQRLLDVLPTDEKSRNTSVAWAADAIVGASRQKLVKAAVGQFDPGTAGTPNTSTFGAAPAMVNPWLFVLMVEGSTLFEAAPARRISAQASVNKGAAMTFMTRGASAGFASGADAEDTRGEVWLPWWTHWLGWPAVKRIFVEGRATWRGKTATRSGDMYLAVGTRGVSASISEFDRFSFVQRNGLAYSAVRADVVGVANEGLLRIVAMVEDWPQRLAGRGAASNSVALQLRRFDRTRVDLARARSAGERRTRLCAFLKSLTHLELAVSRSGSLKEAVRPRGVSRGSGEALLDILRQTRQLEALEASPAFRIALGLASVRMQWTDDRWIGIRELLLPVTATRTGSHRPEWTASSEITGFGFRPLNDVLAEVVAGLAVKGGAVESNESMIRRSVDGLAMPTGVPVPLAHLHRFVRGDVSMADVAAWFDALLVFDWSGDHSGLTSTVKEPLVPEPALGLLGLLRNGLGAPKSGSAVEPGDDAPKGLTVDIVGSLTSGHVERSVTLARQRLHEVGYTGVTSVSSRCPPSAIAACLLPWAPHHALSERFVFKPAELLDSIADSDTESELSHGQ